MTIDAIREAIHTVPFRPFALRMAGGPVIKVKHPDYIAFGPKGRTLVVYGDDDSFKVVDVMLLTELEWPAPTATRRR